MGILTGKRGLIVGVSNKWSIGSQIAIECENQGAEVFVTWHSDRNKKYVQDTFGFIRTFNLDSVSEESLSNIKNIIDGKIDFVIHSVARAPKECLKQPFSNITLEHWNYTLAISSWSLVGLTNAVLPIMNDGGSILTMSYIGGRRVIPTYKILGIAKAALDATVRELAYELGRSRCIRVNALSPGPIKTTSSSGLNISKALDRWRTYSPLERSQTYADITNSAIFMLSDMSSGITGTILDVDSGFNIMASL